MLIKYGTKMINNARKYIVIITMQMMMYSLPALSVPVDVLNSDEIISSDINTLLEDTKVFNTIGMGIALSIAQCDGQDICDITTGENEIVQLIEALDIRIEDVISRQQHNEEELSHIITAYVDIKEKYNGYMERLSKIVKRPEVEIPVYDIFADDEAMTEDEYAAFNDSEDELDDDEELEEFEDDPELDEF